jgi:hypothetical protein
MECGHNGGPPFVYGAVYDRLIGRSFLVHIGRRAGLTPEFLDERAAKLAARLRDYVLPVPRWMRCPRCGR